MPGRLSGDFDSRVGLRVSVDLRHVVFGLICGKLRVHTGQASRTAEVDARFTW